MSELRACPFCGGEASERNFTEPFKNGWVGCQKCRCFIEWVKEGKLLAVAAWNRRTPDMGNPVTEVKPIEIEGDENKPLSIEELRGLDGCPVWICSLEQNKEILEDWYQFVYEHKEFLAFFMFGNECEETFRISNHGKTWLAYRRKPDAKEEAE